MAPELLVGVSPWLPGIEFRLGFKYGLGLLGFGHFPFLFNRLAAVPCIRLANPLPFLHLEAWRLVGLILANSQAFLKVGSCLANSVFVMAIPSF